MSKQSAQETNSAAFGIKIAGKACKLDAKTWKGILLGYARNGYRVWHPQKHQIMHVRDVDFVESIRNDHKPGFSYQRVSDTMSVVTADNHELIVAELKPDDQASNSKTESESEYESFNEEDYSNDREPDMNHDIIDDSRASGESKVKRNRKPPAWQDDFHMNLAACALNAIEYVQDLPRTLAEAKARNDWPKWKDAVEEEMAALKKNKTWT